MDKTNPREFPGFVQPEKARTYLRGYFAYSANTLKALDLVFQYHKGQRKDGSPEWSHQLFIVMYLMTLEKGFQHPAEHIYWTALLHDIHEDYGYSLGSIGEIFGEETKKAVALLSKVSVSNWQDWVQSGGERKKTTAQYYEDLARNQIASVVKGADRVHNVQSMVGAFSREKMISYLSESTSYVLPMLKAARKNFPAQRQVYENIKHVLVSQITLIEGLLGMAQHD